LLLHLLDLFANFKVLAEGNIAVLHEHIGVHLVLLVAHEKGDGVYGDPLLLKDLYLVGKPDFLQNLVHS